MRRRRVEKELRRGKVGRKGKKFTEKVVSALVGNRIGAYKSQTTAFEPALNKSSELCIKVHLKNKQYKLTLSTKYEQKQQFQEYTNENANYF